MSRMNAAKPLSGTPAKNSKPSSSRSARSPSQDVTIFILPQLVHIQQPEDFLHWHHMLVTVGEPLAAEKRAEGFFERLHGGPDAVVGEDNESEARIGEL